MDRVFASFQIPVGLELEDGHQECGAKTQIHTHTWPPSPWYYSLQDFLGCLLAGIDFNFLGFLLVVIILGLKV